ncbi:hypothetical protein [Moorena producens]|uniref:hypothetical protein n=1 Tax=Moorena producens TaxID=1155739 RepID=UPI000B1F7DC7|nr:hypothetical protein [Moorena producens]
MGASHCLDASLLLFDTVVRYGAGYPKPGYEAENEAPLTHPTQLFPIPYSLLPAPCSLLPAPCSLLPAPCSLLPVPCSLFPFYS